MVEYNEILDFNPNKKMLICLDWLTVNVQDRFSTLQFPENQLIVIDNYVFEFVPNKKTTNFNKFINLYRDGVPVSQIAYESNSPVVLKNRAHIKFDNTLFYNQELQQVYDFLQSINLINTPSISKVDIAVDGAEVHQFISKFYFNEINQNHIFRVRDNDNIIINNPTRSQLQNHCFDSFYVGQLGSKTTGKARSSKFIRYYNKTQEIRDRGFTKQYILNWQNVNGLPNDKDIYRFEISLNADFFSKIQFSVDDLFNHDKLTTLFFKSLENMFEFRYRTDSNVSRCELIEIFKLDFKPLPVLAQKKEPEKLRTIKISIKRAFEDITVGKFMKDTEIQLISIQYIRKLIYSYNLYEWFTDRHRYWLQRIQQLEIIKGYSVEWQFKNSQYFTDL